MVSHSKDHNAHLRIENMENDTKFVISAITLLILTIVIS